MEFLDHKRLEIEEERKRVADKEKIEKRIMCVWLCSILASVFGWIYETSYDLVVNHMLAMRASFIFPWCPVYAVGMALIICVSKYNYVIKNHEDDEISWVGAFSISMLVSTLSELIGSYVIEFMSGKLPWDYSTYPFNFQGRIALLPAIVFGIGGMLILKIFWNKVKAFIEKDYDTAKMISFLILGACIGDIALEIIGFNTMLKSSINEKISWLKIQGMM